MMAGEGERKHGAIEQLYRSRYGPRWLGPGESDGSFSPGVTFGTQSSAIKPVCKNFEKHRNIPLHSDGAERKKRRGEERRGEASLSSQVVRA